MSPDAPQQHPADLPVPHALTVRVPYRLLAASATVGLAVALVGAGIPRESALLITAGVVLVPWLMIKATAPGIRQH
ncbi:hypothetical protein ACFWWM_04840 [Streptomyces sp. NPDC058682]|uniref:hypothetical protein n=1 Tax=Streptomyces sp. NPDC058682 TaxID=3346596 RepID=UPI0036581B74